MRDGLGREIDYMRISVTDRCDLRCTYCMPHGVGSVSHEDILRYEEILRVARAALCLGIDRFKVTGGEPFARLGAADFIAALKAEPRVRSVTVTTNGTHLSEALPRLIEAGIDGVNISLDALDPSRYAAITGKDCADCVLEAVARCAASGIRTKVNSVLLADNAEEILPLARLAQHLPVDVRFIELMPIGCGMEHKGFTADAALVRLMTAFPGLRPVEERRGNGPAAYFASDALKGRIGFIAANSHSFCASCNRVRLTSTGLFKPCLCYEAAADLRALLRGGADEAELMGAMADAIQNKPAAHCFSSSDDITENRGMNEIGG